MSTHQARSNGSPRARGAKRIRHLTRWFVRSAIALAVIAGMAAAFPGFGAVMRPAPEVAVAQPPSPDSDWSLRRQTGAFNLGGSSVAISYLAVPETAGINGDSRGTSGKQGPTQTQARTGIGSLTATGDAFLNARPITGETSVFIGDSVQTGTTGSAIVTVPERGQLSLAPITKITLQQALRFYATLETGRVTLRALAGARNFQVRIGSLTVTPSPDVNSTAVIERLADGSGTVKCVEGSIGIIELEGPEAIFLSADESASFTADGRMQKAAPGAPAAPAPGPAKTTPSPSPAPVEVKKGGSGKWVLLAVAVGGGAGAAAAAAGKGGRTPVSP